MKILLVEDDAILRRTVAKALTLSGYEVAQCENADEGLFYMQSGGFDLVVLDRMLPGGDGVGILKAARREGVATPVLVLSAMNNVGDKVAGLNAGADDYLPKPFEMEELLARVAALSRRPAAIEQHTEYCHGDICYRPGGLVLAGPTGEARLSPREGALMELFVRSGGATISRGTIFNRVWGPDSGVEEGNISTYIHFLRRRLGEVGSRAKFVNRRGVGFELCAGEDGL